MKHLVSIALGAALFAASVLQAQGTTTAANGERCLFSAAARYHEVDLTKAKRQALISLRSENEGVVQSTLAQLAWMRIAAPAEDMAAIREEIEGLAEHGMSDAVRIKASLTLALFTRPAAYTALLDSTFYSGDEFYYAFTVRLAAAEFAARR